MNVNVLLYGLKMSIYVPKLCVIGAVNYQVGTNINAIPKAHPLVIWRRVIYWSICCIFYHFGDMAFINKNSRRQAPCWILPEVVTHMKN